MFVSKKTYHCHKLISFLQCHILFHVKSSVTHHTKTNVNNIKIKVFLGLCLVDALSDTLVTWIKKYHFKWNIHVLFYPNLDDNIRTTKRIVYNDFSWYCSAGFKDVQLQKQLEPECSKTGVAVVSVILVSNVIITLFFLIVLFRRKEIKFRGKGLYIYI